MSEAERAFIARYASMLREAPTTVVPILKVIEAADPRCWETIHSLIARGWLVVSEPMAPVHAEQCVLCGHGLEIARQMADKVNPGSGDNGNGNAAASVRAGGSAGA